MDPVYIAVLVAAGVVALIGTRLLRRPLLSFVVATALGPLYLFVVFAQHEPGGGGGAPMTEIAYLFAVFFSAFSGAIGVALGSISSLETRNGK
jgi:hypothetical protein